METRRTSASSPATLSSAIKEATAGETLSPATPEESLTPEASEESFAPREFASSGEFASRARAVSPAAAGWDALARALSLCERTARVQATVVKKAATKKSPAAKVETLRRRGCAPTRRR